MTNTGLPSPPLDDDGKPPSRRASSKLAAKHAHRTSKRTTSVTHDHSASILDGRHKRVWKACERCRMKKTKCDGESPCKRCKDDGLVCTAGTRKKTEFKQLPRGYAEVLENTQYALIATVQKLYSMVRNHEEWDLGEPDLNDRGQPVIHNIAEKLGCIRPSPDLPHVFPEGAEDFVDLENQLLAAQADEQHSHSHDKVAPSENGSSNGSTSTHVKTENSPPGLARTDRASSSETDHSELSQDYNQMLWTQAKQQQRLQHQQQQQETMKAKHVNFASSDAYTRPSLESIRSVPSPVFTDFSTAQQQQQVSQPTQPSPLFETVTSSSSDSAFSPWSVTGTDFLAPNNMLDLTSQYLQQDFMNRNAATLAQGTIRPGMLDCSAQMNLNLMQDEMDSIIYGTTDYDAINMV